ncbi:MAG: tol-pal system protein YbgF [Pseudomonadota bacterium]
MSPRLFLALMFCSAAVSLPAFAQDRLSRAELTAETRRLTSELSGVDERTNQLQVQNADLALKVRELETENAQLTGRIETLQFQLSRSRDEVAQMQADDQEIGRQLDLLRQKIVTLEAIASEQNRLILDGQLSPDGAPLSVISSLGSSAPDPTETRLTSSVQGEGGAAASSPEGLGTLAASDLPGEAGPLFADAKAKLLRFDYAGAERSFRAFLDRFGDDPQAGEAQYWLGEVLYQQQSYDASGAAYSDMIRNFPEDARAPDALVKLGRSLRLVGEAEKACGVLDTLPTRYPDASPVTRNLANVERSRSGCEG